MNFILFLLPIILSGTKSNFLQNNHFEKSINRTLQAQRAIPDSTNMVNHNIQYSSNLYETFDENHYNNRNESNNAISLVSEESTCSVLGSDERTEINNPKETPYLQTAYIRCIYSNVYNNSKSAYETVTHTGTAFLERPNLAVTAGHCVYSDVTTEDYEDNVDNPRFPDKIEFYFGCSRKNDYQQGSNYQYYAEAKIINIEYKYYRSRTTNQDWAAVELDRNIGYSTGWYGKSANFFSVNYPIYSWGYPGDKTKATLWKTSGTLKATSKFKYSYDIDTENGQSGSPIFIEKPDGHVYVCGIHTSGKSTASPDSNRGTIINSFIYSYLNSYVTSYTDTPIFHDYLDLSIVSKQGSTWKIEITNHSSHKRSVSYNERMCFDEDAKNWTKLEDLKTVNIKTYSSTEVLISKNWFAGTIAVSFETNQERLITYANNLKIDTKSLNQYTSLIQL